MVIQNRKSQSNISQGVMFILRGAKKRRSMAMANAKMIQSELGVTNKLIAIK